MAQTLGQVIRAAREKADMTREQLAKKLKISAAYVGHMERDTPVRVSPRVTLALKKSLGRHISSLTKSLVATHNRKNAKSAAKHRKAARN